MQPKAKSVAASKPDISDFNVPKKDSRERNSSTVKLAKSKGLVDGELEEAQIYFQHPSTSTPLKQRNGEGHRPDVAKPHSPFRFSGWNQADPAQRRSAMTPIRARPLFFNIDSSIHDETPHRNLSANDIPLHVSPLFEIPSVDRQPTDTKLAPLPKFDIGQPTKGKTVSMAALELPVIATQEEAEVKGEALEIQRGLLISPEKGGGKGKRFIRCVFSFGIFSSAFLSSESSGGLAERAQHLLARSSTSDTLWRKELESQASSRSKLRPDLRVRVREVLEVSRIENMHARASGSLRSVLIICDVVDPKAHDALVVDGQRSIMNVLLSFDHGSSHASSSESGPKIQNGSEVLIWRPWREVSQSDSSPSAMNSPANHPFFRNNLSAVLCSRFVVLFTSST